MNEITMNDLSLDILRHYCLTLGQNADHLSPDYLYRAVAMAIRDRLVERWKKTRDTRQQDTGRHVTYLSLEFLMGRALTNAVHALNLESPLREFLLAYGTDLERVADMEHDAGLGNGGLGRLAACFLDSCATMALPVTGYGIRYEYGMFHQRIERGEQVEYPDHWLRDGNPWEFERAEDTRRVRFHGRTELMRSGDGSFRVHWLDTEDVLAIPFDLLIPGHGGKTVNRLRLWKAAATDDFNLREFNAGSYTEAVEEKNRAENITMVLYPNDVSENGKALRLRQQYFLASATLQDVVHDWVLQHGPNFDGFGAAHVFQLNDTHPSCAIPEFMRILLDDYGFGWDEAWKITATCMAYTNHTLLPEALEKWSVRLFERLLPRLLEIIYEINARFLQQVSLRWPGDVPRLQRMSLIEEGDDRRIRMAWLAIVGSFSVNGVAALHTQLLTRDLFRDFFDLWPERFNNKTNGVTPRRWIQHANPGMTELVTAAIGSAWVGDTAALSALAPLATDAGFQSEWARIRLHNKQVLARRVAHRTGIEIDPAWLFDVQVKRIHEYKRQLLNILHAVHLYDRIHRGDGDDLIPRVILIGGKAAPGYAQAKRIIHFINCVAAVINADPLVSRILKVVFLPNYDVSWMEVLCPATDLSEQISTAGKEASGTGNMKFMMNGAVTIGTLDGANIEIRDRVGTDNFFLFGLTADEVLAKGDYDPTTIIAADDDLQRVLALVDSGQFSLFSPQLFLPITDSIRVRSDPWMVAADFRSYMDAQAGVDQAWRDPSGWHRMSILNTAASGWFSSDRTITEYATDIWRIPTRSTQ
jgi:glycogen phosphorylase